MSLRAVILCLLAAISLADGVALNAPPGTSAPPADSTIVAPPETRDPCASCYARNYTCLTCNDGRHACATEEQASKNATCCGCTPNGPGSICTLCLQGDSCTSSEKVKSGYYCYTPSYLSELWTATHSKTFPRQVALPAPTEIFLAMLPGVLPAIFAPSGFLLFTLCCWFCVIGKSEGGGGGDGSDYSSSRWDHDDSGGGGGGGSSSWDSGGGGGDGGGSSSSWDSGPSYTFSAD